MKKKIVKVLLVVFLFSFMTGFNAPSFESNEEYAWVLVDTKYQVHNQDASDTPAGRYEFDRGGDHTDVVYVGERSVERKRTGNFSEGVPGVNLHVKYTWSAPPSVIRADDKPSFAVNVDVISNQPGNLTLSYGWNIPNSSGVWSVDGTDDDRSIYVGQRTDNNDRYSYEVKQSSTVFVSLAREWPVGGDNSSVQEGDIRTITVVAANNVVEEYIYEHQRLSAITPTSQIPPITEDRINLETASDWAKPELSEAYDINLIPSVIMGNYNNNITRAEFSSLIVRMFELINGSSVSVPDNNPFIDTDDINVLKAHSLGIVIGRSSTVFDPHNNISRQELAIMIYRALNELKVDDMTDIRSQLTFADNDSIAVWALTEVSFIVDRGLIQGVGNNLLDPLGTTTREQSIALVLRTLQRYSN